MNVLFFSPGYPAEMPYFVRGLAQSGARVVGLGDQPASALPPMARQHVVEHLQVSNLWDAEGVLEAVRRLSSRVRIDRIECLWEPGMILAAQLRQALGLPGMTVAQTVPFRDKEQMKQALDRAGIRTPRHARGRTEAACREAAERIGYPLIVKPIAGAGSADTHRLDGPADLERVLPRLRHVPEVSVEEFIEGEEFTFDTICAGGEILFANICWYRPRPLTGRTVEWISPQTVALRDLAQTDLAGGWAMGRAVLSTLGFRTGFSHMEWYRKADGEVVFGEIAARPPGARTVDIMNYACDADLFTAWAEAVCHRRLARPITRVYNAAVIFKRAQGEGRIRRIEGLEALRAAFGKYLVATDLLPVGAQRRNWKQTLISDGYLIVRHPDLATCLAMADRVGTDLRLYAG